MELLPIKFIVAKWTDFCTTDDVEIHWKAQSGNLESKTK